METWTWETIADTLIKEIQKGIYKKDEKMPSENKMAVRFQVPRSEIRKAYARLKEMGYIYALQGYGSFFSGNRKKIRLSMSNESFSKKMEQMGIHFQTRNMGCRKIKDGSLIHTNLGLECHEPVYKVTRLRILDGEPAAIHISYLAEKLFPLIEKEGGALTSVYEYFHQNGYQDLDCTNLQLTVSTLNKKERTLLNIQGYAPFLVLTYQCRSMPQGQVIEVGRTIYRSDKFILEL